MRTGKVTFKIHSGTDKAAGCVNISKTFDGGAKIARGYSRKNPGVTFSVFSQDETGFTYLVAQYLNGESI